MEADEIQSYLDAQWSAYQELNPNDDECPVRVRKAKWARENYYYLLHILFPINLQWLVHSLLSNGAEDGLNCSSGLMRHLVSLSGLSTQVKGLFLRLVLMSFVFPVDMPLLFEVGDGSLILIHFGIFTITLSLSIEIKRLEKFKARKSSLS